MVHSTCIKRYDKYVNDIMDENHKPKRLWSFIKSKRTDSCGIAPLKRDGIAYSDARMKANILNNQFTSVFISRDHSQPLPDLGPSPHPAVSDITITQEGVQIFYVSSIHTKPPVPTKSDIDCSRKQPSRSFQHWLRYFKPQSTKVKFQKNGNPPTSHHSSNKET